MSWKSACKHLVIVFILTASLSFGLVQPVFAANKVTVSPSTANLTEGSSLELDTSLDEPIITGDPSPGYLVINFTSSHPNRLSLADSGIYYDASEWNAHKPLAVTANEDPFVNQDVTVTVSFEVESNSEYYDGYTGSVTINVQNNDDAPSVAITYPEPGKSLPAGSLMITGTATPNKEIAVMVDGKDAGVTRSDEAGDWDLLIAKISAGKHDIVAQVQTSDHYAYMANAYTESIDVVNLDTHEYVYEITETGSVGTTFNTHDNTVYSASTLDGVCYVIAYDPLSLEEKFRLTDESNAENCSSIGMTLSPDGKKAYLLIYDGDFGSYNAVAVFNLGTRSFESGTTLDELDGNYPSGMSLTPDASQLWIRINNGIERISTTGYINLGHIALDESNAAAYRQNIVFNKAGTRAYSADSGSGLVYVIDTSSNEVIDTIELDTNLNMVALSPDESKLFVAAAYPTSAIFVINTSNNEVIDTEAVPSHLPPESLAINQDGQWVVGDDHGSGAIFFGDVNNNATVASTIYAPRGGSYYTSTSNFASPTLFNVLGVSTSFEFSAVDYSSPNTGLARNSD